MADKKISSLSELTSVATDDELAIVDKSDTTQAATGTTKKITKANLTSGFLAASSNLSDVASAATAFGNIKQAATDSATGVVELATNAETLTGTDTSRAVTPDDLAYVGMLTGWIPSGETWTYSSVDDPTGVFTISGDLTTKYSAGMRIKMTNGGNTIYGIITKVAYGAPNTSITFLHEIDPTDSQALYLLANSAITNPYFSTQKSPFGFPLDPLKWTVKYSTDTDRNKTNPSQNTWYGGSNAWTSGSNISFDVPIGSWNFSYFANAYAQESSSGTAFVNVTLSTSNSSESDSELTSLLSLTMLATTSNNVPVVTVNKSKFLTVTSKTTYYMLAKTTQSSQEDIRLRSSQGATIIKATCTYL